MHRLYLLWKAAVNVAQVGVVKWQTPTFPSSPIGFSHPASTCSEITASLGFCKRYLIPPSSLALSWKLSVMLMLMATGCWVRMAWHIISLAAFYPHIASCSSNFPFHLYVHLMNYMGAGLGVWFLKGKHVPSTATVQMSVGEIQQAIWYVIVTQSQYSCCFERKNPYSGLFHHMSTSGLSVSQWLFSLSIILRNSELKWTVEQPAKWAKNSIHMSQWQCVQNWPTGDPHCIEVCRLMARRNTGINAIVGCGSELPRKPPFYGDFPSGPTTMWTRPVVGCAPLTAQCSHTVVSDY